jgi:hypothetical protein
MTARRYLLPRNSADQWRSAGRGDEGFDLGEPARAGLDRPGYARHRAEHLHPKVEKVEGELYNIEFATFEAVKDPDKASK